MKKIVNLMWSIKELPIVLVLLTLVAFSPWQKTNEALGIKPTADSVKVESIPDVLMEPVKIVLAPDALDTLARYCHRKDSLRQALQIKIKKLDKEIGTLGKVVKKKQEDIVDLEEIARITERQRRPGDP